jgi:hypothetical protein
MTGVVRLNSGKILKTVVFEARRRLLHPHFGLGSNATNRIIINICVVYPYFLLVWERIYGFNGNIVYCSCVFVVWGEIKVALISEFCELWSCLSLLVGDRSYCCFNGGETVVIGVLLLAGVKNKLSHFSPSHLRYHAWNQRRGISCPCPWASLDWKCSIHRWPIYTVSHASIHLNYLWNTQ